MIFVYTFLTIVLFILWCFFVKNQVKDKMSSRLIYFFGVYWFLSLLLASIQASGIREISFYTMMLMYVNVFSFSIGYSLVKVKPTSALNVPSISSRIECIVKNKIYIAILALCSFYVYTLLVQFFDKIILYETLYDVRKEYYEQELYGPLFSQLNAFILKPLALFTAPLFGYMIFKKRNIVCLLMAFFLVGYYSLGGGRIGYVSIIMAVVCVAYCCFQFIERIKKKHVIVITIIGGLFFIFMSFITAARYGNIGLSKDTLEEGSTATVKSIISYTGAPIAAFDVAREGHFENYIGGMANGNLTLTCALSAVNLVGVRMGFKIPVKLPDLIEQKQEQNIDVGKDLEWNALYTAVLFFYLDFGFLGVLIIPLLLGLLYRKMIVSLYKFHNVPYLVIVTYLFYLTFYSVLDFGLTTPYDFIFLVVMLVIGRIKTSAYGK